MNPEMNPAKPDTQKLPLIAALLTLTIGSLTVLPASAETAEEKGLAIAVESDKRDTGWGDATANMRMVLRNKGGKKSIREMRIRTIEVADDGDKSLIIFDNPKDVKGTALLTFSHKTGTDDQWIYLPALKRVKRIASRNKTGPFMGSEFAYEDMTPPEVAKYTYKYLRDETLDGKPCFVVERYPVDKNSGYSRQVVWVDKAEYRPWKIEFYDRKDFHLKTLQARDYQQYLGQYWRPHKSLMLNNQTGKSTLLSYQDYQFGTGLSEADFNKGKLRDVN